jgi:hypothetical protein
VDKWYTFREEEKKDVRGILGGYFVPVPKDYKLSKRGHLQIITSVQPTIFFIQLLLESGKRPAARGAATVRGGQTWWAPWAPASGSAQQDVALTGEASKEYDARNIFLVYVHETSAGHSTTSVVQKKKHEPFR